MKLEESLNNLQKECDELYKEFGVTDEIIQLQISINLLRNKFDIPDQTKLTESNKDFVQ